MLSSRLLKAVVTACLVAVAALAVGACGDDDDDGGGGGGGSGGGEERLDRAAAARVEDRTLRVSGPAQLREEGQGALLGLRDRLQQRRPGRRPSSSSRPRRPSPRA